MVAEHHFGARFFDQAPDPERIGAAGEGIAGEQQAVPVVGDGGEQVLQFSGATMGVADEDRAHRSFPVFALRGWKYYHNPHLKSS